MDLNIQSLGHYYSDLEILRNINLDVPAGQIVAVIGPSGCGKSTLLRMIGGLEQPTSGAVLQVGETPNDSLNPLTYIFQDFALLPWRSVAGNISLVLEDHKLGSAEVDEIIENVLSRTKLGDFRDAFPHQLSGGMKQRVAIARDRPVENRWIGQRLDEPTPDIVGFGKAQGFEGEGPISDVDEFMKALERGAKIIENGGRYVIDVSSVGY